MGSGLNASAEEAAPASRIAVSEEPDGVMTISMQDRAGRNGLSERLVSELLAALNVVSRAPGAKAVVLLGLPDVFCSGATPAMLERFSSGASVAEATFLPRAVLDVPVPTIAAMEGHAIGGGLALGLCADIVIISKESRYGCSFMNMGFTPGMGTTRLLETVLSPAIAHELMYTGEYRRGSEFDARSGFNYILAREAVQPKALEIASRIAEKPRAALEVLKQGLASGKRRAFEETRTVEALMHSVTFAQTGIRRLIEDGYAE